MLIMQDTINIISKMNLSNIAEVFKIYKNMHMTLYETLFDSLEIIDIFLL